MAEVITKEQLENASVDAKDLGECVHGNESGIVTPRIGDPYPTLPAAIAAVENKGGYITTPTLAALSAIVPEFNHQVARVEESGDEYRWDPSATPLAKWVPTGKNWLNAAKDFANANANFNPIKIGDVSLDTLIQVGIYFATDVAFAKLENNYPLARLTGIIHVASANNSTLIFQEFRSAQGTDYWRSWNNVSWSAWKLKIDLSLYELKSTALTDRGILTDQDLNDLKLSGRYSLSDGTTIATLEKNYPIVGASGTLEVIKNTGSSLVLQRFVVTGTNSTSTYTRIFKNEWTDWTSEKVKIVGMLDEGILGTTTLDDVRTIGVYVQNVAASATSVRGYPILQAGVLEVTKTESSALTVQKYTSTNGKIFVRVFSTSWSAWLEHGGISVQQSNLGKITAVFSSAMNADELRSEFCYYIVNNNNLDLEATKLPIKAFGLLKIYRGTVSSFIVQEFIAGTGLIYTRYWNNVVWTAWKLVGGSSTGEISETITFSKTATTLYFNLQNSGSGENVIKHRFIRQTDPERNLDNWGMSTCSVMTKADTTVSNLTTNGVWEVAIVDSQNISDHSGGGHGDEVKFLSYFLVDGVKYDEDFTGILSAKEVKHVQHSVIYVEAQNIPICTRKTTWTFNKNGCTSKTKLDWAEGRNINKARIAMLPIYRKSNDDGTGNQITDTEIRSQDDQIINVAEHGFALRDLPITAGDSILLSSAISNISAEVKVKKIVAQDPHAYVQNTILYNKVYVNGFKETAAPFVTGANDVWEIETDFVIKVRG